MVAPAARAVGAIVYLCICVFVYLCICLCHHQQESISDMVAPAARAVGADPDQWEREGGGSKVGAREEESGACNTSSGADNQEQWC